MPDFIRRIFESRQILTIMLMVIIYGLFFIPISQDSTHVADEFWNLGHVGGFFFLSIFAMNMLPQCQRLSAVALLFLFTGTALFAGVVIEWLQSFVHRDVELGDVLNSGVGAVLAVSFISKQVRQLTLWKRLTWRMGALVVLLVVPWSIWSVFIDAYTARQQFPVLCDFSTKLEMKRWHASRAMIYLQKNLALQRPFLTIQFRPANYSTVSFNYFYPDWHGYKHLIIDLANPENSPLDVTLRMHDRLHKHSNFAYEDRFNRKIVIQPGEQLLDIALPDVEKAPASRKMDLRHMEEIGIFISNSKTYRMLYINKIYLQ